MFSKSLINEYPLMMLPSLGVAVGPNEALVLQQLHYWLTHSKHRRYEREHYWIDNSYKQLQRKFPFWTESTLEIIMKSLEKKGLLVRAFLNTPIPKWYTIDYNGVNALIAKATTPAQGSHIDNQTTPNQTKEERNIPGAGMLKLRKKARPDKQNPEELS